MSDDVSHWLEQIGLAQYTAVFADSDIDFTLLPDLDNDVLKDIGIATAGHRLRILKAAKLLDSKLSSQESSGSSAARESPDDSNAEGDQTHAERRQLTVMFCDLVGSTSLSQTLDAEALREVMQAYQQACRQIIDRYDGHVAQYLGDGLMTYFGWPRAHEDSAERSVRAGLDIIEAVSRLPATVPLQVRIGIATGEVVVGETGSGDASVPKLAVGETPNLAARVQGLAQADQIIISPDTRRLVGGTFELIDLGEQTLKGIVDPVRAWRVTGLATTDGRFDASRRASELTPVVGREEELGMLLRRWQLAQGKEGQVVLLSGEPGIGKSRLINALRENLRKDQANAMRFQCSPYYVNSALWPSIQSLERALKMARDESAETKLDKLESLIVGHFKRPVTDVRFVASLLSIPASITDERYGTLNMTPQKFKDETLRTLVDLTEATANEQPTVLLFEDAHWADPASLELLTLTIDRVATMPLLVLITHRPEFENRWADHGHVTALNLTKLTRAQSSQLVKQVTKGKTLPDDLLEQVLAKTDGVPLFIEEVTQSILESGELIERANSYDYAGAGREVTIPATLRDSLMARLDRYQPVREIAQIGAAIGRQFSYQLVAAVAPIPTAALDKALAQLTDSGLAFRRGTPPDAVYTFKHALVQDAAYDSLLKSRRQALHGKIAQALDEHLPQSRNTEPEILAHHLTDAGDLTAAIPLWQQAGELAHKRMALTEAISHWNQGLMANNTLPACAERDSRELDFRVALGLAWTQFKSWPAPEVGESLRPAIALAKNLKRDDQLCTVLWALLGHYHTLSQLEEAFSLANELLAIGKRSGDMSRINPGFVAVGCVSYSLGRFAEAMAYLNEPITQVIDGKQSIAAVESDHVQKTSAGIWAARAAWMLGYPDKAVRLLQEAVTHARQGNDPFILGFALSFGADVFLHRGEFQECRKCVEECEQLGRENSMPALWAVQAPIRLGWCLIVEGKITDGIRLFRQGSSVWESVGGKLNVPSGKALLADAMATLGDIDYAFELLDEAINQVERPGWNERCGYAEILRVKGRVLALKGDHIEAENSYLASLDCAREQQAKSWELRTATSLARLWQQQSKHQQALELLEPVYGWFTEGFDTTDLKEARALLDGLK